MCGIFITRCVRSSLPSTSMGMKAILPNSRLWCNLIQYKFFVLGFETLRSSQFYSSNLMTENVSLLFWPDAGCWLKTIILSISCSFCFSSVFVFCDLCFNSIISFTKSPVLNFVMPSNATKCDYYFQCTLSVKSNKWKCVCVRVPCAVRSLFF